MTVMSSSTDNRNRPLLRRGQSWSYLRSGRSTVVAIRSFLTRVPPCSRFMVSERIFWSQLLLNSVHKDFLLLLGGWSGAFGSGCLGRRDRVVKRRVVSFRRIHIEALKSGLQQVRSGRSDASLVRPSSRVSRRPRFTIFCSHAQTKTDGYSMRALYEYVVQCSLRPVYDRTLPGHESGKHFRL